MSKGRGGAGRVGTRGRGAGGVVVAGGVTIADNRPTVDRVGKWGGKESLSAGEEIFWRVNQAGDPLSQAWRSSYQAGDLEGRGSGEEKGTSATTSLGELMKWATGGYKGGVAPSGHVDVIRFVGRRTGTGADGEPIVRPLRELGRATTYVDRKQARVSQAWADLTKESFRPVATRKVRK